MDNDNNYNKIFSEHLLSVTHCFKYFNTFSHHNILMKVLVLTLWGVCVCVHTLRLVEQATEGSSNLPGVTELPCGNSASRQLASRATVARASHRQMEIDETIPH